MKAIILDAAGNKSAVITNVRNYTENCIYGNEELEGTYSPFILVADDTDESNPDSWIDLKPEQDRLKANQASIEELQNQLSALDYVVIQRKREQDLGLPLSKTEQEYQVKLNEMQRIVEQIRTLKGEN